MPSFSRATTEMRCSRAAWAISISEGMCAGILVRGRRDCGRLRPPRALTEIKPLRRIRESTMERCIDWRLLAAAALLAVAFAARAQAPGVNATQILIGQSVPLTGSNAEFGNDILKGALAYFRKVNEAGGVHGRQLEIVALDDANLVARAEANTVKLVEETRVFALFGYASATLSRPALPIVEKHGVPFLAPFTGADPMRAFNRHVYNMRASYADELEKIVEHFVSLGVKRFSIVYYDDVVGRENFTAVQRALKKRALEPVSTAALKERA